MVCTPGWLAAELNDRVGIVGRHYFVVGTSDLTVIEDELRRRIEMLEAPDWPSLAEKIGRIERWEFEDYRP